MIERDADGPRPMGHQAIHDTVRTILRAKRRGDLLDVPAGEGALAQELSADGFRVICADLYPEIFRVDELSAVRADLDGELPFENERFDHVVCVEGLEHIESPANAVREFSRVLRSGGTLVISVPNILNLEERFKWLLFGYTSHFKPVSRQVLEEIGRDYKGMEEIALHINPIGYSELRYLLEKYGFELTGAHRDKPKRNSWAYRPAAALIRLVSKLTPKAKRRSRWSDELNSEEVLMGGNTLIFEAVKLPDTGKAPDFNG